MQTAYRYPMTQALPDGGTLAPWARLLEQAGQLILRLVAAHAAARRKRATMYELQRLSERDLEDIGLTRGDVDLMAAGAPASLQAIRDRGLVL